MTRPKPLAKQLEDLRSEVELMRMAQDRLFNLVKLQEALRDSGVSVEGYEGPARYELGRVVQCELCGELLDASDMSYELRLRSKAWGPRYGYVHRECFEKATALDE